MWISLVAAVLIPAQADSAEAQFKKMEQQILKAKTLQSELDIVAKGDKETFMAVKGRIAIAQGGKIRLELEGEVQKDKDKMTMVSDGKQMVMDSSKRPGKSQDAQKQMTEITLAAMARSGIVPVLFFASDRSDEKEDKTFDIDKMFKITDLKLGKKGAIDGKETQAIEYKLTPKLAKETMTMTVWIDVKTNLPVKRVAESKEGDKMFTITETYGKLTLDGKVDDKEFVLPK